MQHSLPRVSTCSGFLLRHEPPAIVACPPTCAPPGPPGFHPLAPLRRRGKAFSRRRAFNPNKDIDYINERNAHFNKKIERAFGTHTAEIKANLERGERRPIACS